MGASGRRTSLGHATARPRSAPATGVRAAVGWLTPQREIGLLDSAAPTYWAWAVVLLVGFASFHLWYIGAAQLDLAPDEAHYWEWSRRLDWGYYSKGPMVAYLIALTTRLGPDSAFAVRLPAVLLALLCGALLYQLAGRLFGARAALFTVLAATACPLVNAGAVLMTIDAPLMFSWILALVALQRGFDDATTRRELWWLLFGVALGLGVLSKYTMLLILPSAAIYAAVSPRARVALREPWPYLALGVTALLAAPMLMWNAHHGWVSLRHVLARTGMSSLGLSSSTAPFSVVDLVEFLGSQIGCVSPLLFAAVATGVAYIGRTGWRTRNDACLFVFIFCAVPFGLFLLWSLHDKVEANWAAPAYATALVATGAWWDRYLRAATPRRQARSRMFLVGFVLLTGSGLTALAHFPALPAVFGAQLPHRFDPTTRLRGWSDLGAVVGDLRGSDRFLMSDFYQIASELAFYAPGHPVVYNVNLGRRMNQYDMWGGMETLAGRDGLFVTYWNWDVPPALRRACAEFRRLRDVDVYDRGELVRRFTVSLCQQFAGHVDAPPQTTY